VAQDRKKLEASVHRAGPGISKKKQINFKTGVHDESDENTEEKSKMARKNKKKCTSRRGETVGGRM